MSKSRKIKNEARKLGFDLVGITTAAPFSSAYRQLCQRKKKGQLPQFMNRDIELITHPRKVLPGAKSIIVTAMSYALPLPEDEEAYISQYARGQDYHSVIKDRLSRLVAYINTIESGIDCKIICDDGPLLEREAARCSGIGWPGKNTNIINEKYGSYLFLGEIITNLQLEADDPVQSLCGDCNICLQNCAGDALDKNRPYFLDHQQCISYLTQKKGILTEKENQLMGKYLWGCDQCQSVCPYNKDIPVSIHSEFKSLIKPNLEQVLNFKRKGKLPREWQESALSWRGNRILIRNALIVAGNKRQQKYLSLVERLTTSSSPIIKHYACRAREMINLGG